MEVKDNKNISPQLFEPAGESRIDIEKIERPSLSFWHDAWLRLWKNKGAVTGLVVIVLLVAMAFIGPLVSNYTYKEQNIKHAKLPPKIELFENVSWLPFDGIDKNGVDQYAAKGVENYYWFGTDELGRDLWTRTWKGTQVSLLIGLIAALGDLFIGVTYGGISGFYGGRVDNIMQRIVEVIAGIPYLIVVILFILVLDPGILSISLALVITGWIGMSRVVRSQMLKLKGQEFVLASKTLGASNGMLIRKHLLPNVLGNIIIMIMFTIPTAIFSEAFLSFIGLGIRPPLASLGSLVSDGYKSLQSFPHMMIVPAVIISLLILSFNLVADGLRDALDPKMRN